MQYNEAFIDEIIKILVKNKAVKPQEGPNLKRMFSMRSDVAFEEFLIEEDIVEKEDLLKALSEYYKVPALDVEGEFFEHELVKMFPKDIMLRYCFIPYEHEDDILMVVAAQPDDPDLSDVIGRHVSYDVQFMVGYFEDIIDQVEDTYDEPVTDEEEDEDLHEEKEEKHEVDELSEEDKGF